jgi:hypothetical protein
MTANTALIWGWLMIRLRFLLIPVGRIIAMRLASVYLLLLVTSASIV